ncbi:MAG: hypothetical protein K0U47_01965, partial [Epsilonproteobacteria bacterium]|nr:hypothetical protein [Campylobacterota bacterium]
LLSTKQTGYVKGSMYVNNISNEGGKVEGSIGQYKELIETNETAQKPTPVPKPQDNKQESDAAAEATLRK